LAEDFERMGVTQEDLDKIGPYVEGVSRPPIANDDASAALASNTTVAPHRQNQSSLPSSQAPPARPIISGVELGTIIVNLPVAFRKKADWNAMAHLLDFPRAVAIIGADQFIREPGTTRDVLRHGSAFAKGAEMIGLPGGIVRWLQGVPNLSEQFGYPITTVETALTSVKKKLEEATRT
jgi:hypothetical protein